MAFRISLIITFLLLLVNGYIFFNRQNYSFSNQVAYVDLYPVVSPVAITDIRRVAVDKLELILKDVAAGKRYWQIKQDGLSLDTISGNPKITLSEGMHLYKAVSEYDSLVVRAEYIPPQKNKAAVIVLEKTNVALILPEEVKGIESYNPAATDQEKNTYSKS